MSDFVPGLEGVIAFESEIAEPDKDGGSLRYRGVDIEELVGKVSFGDAWGLLVDNSFTPGLPPFNTLELPVRSGDVRDHVMHSEWFDVPQATVEAVAACRVRGGKVVAVGTTTLRALESAAQSGQLEAGARETDIFITPGFEFRVVDRLVTNFHLPKSTLMMLVSALAGYEHIRAIYAHAIAQRLARARNPHRPGRRRCRAADLAGLLAQQHVEPFVRGDQRGAHPPHAGAKHEHVGFVIPAHQGSGPPAGAKRVGSLPLGAA